VNCSSSDSHGNTATGSFTILVRDTTRPTAACSPVVVKRERRDDDDDDNGMPGGLFKVTGSDIVGPLSLAIGPYRLADESVIRLALKRQPGVIEITKETKSGIRRFRVGAADAFILGKDGAGNTTKALCPVAAKDGDDGDERDENRERHDRGHE
jgi:hypothetical protein